MLENTFHKQNIWISGGTALLVLDQMSDEERSGPFEEQHSDEELIAFIQEEEVVTTKEVADYFEYHLQTARRRLKQLQREGDLNMKDVGKRFVWWISTDKNRNVRENSD